MSNESQHWADQTARMIIAQKTDKESYTLAAGITPSGVIHMGNFREVITVDLIKRALESAGKKVRFIYSWDEFDAFRKVPVNMPKQEELVNELRKPLTDVIDPFGCHANYAEHNEQNFEDSMEDVGIDVEFIHQTPMNISGKYAPLMIKALDNVDKIKEILNSHRQEPLADSWLPIEVYDEDTKKDTVTDIKYEGNAKLSFTKQSGSRVTVDLNEYHNVKLKWRTDWPMRWTFENVDFESGGKDHFSKGGSFDTGKEISKQVFDRDAPSSIRYEWISMKGQKQFSSSKGIAFTLKELLKVYSPELVRHLFAGSRPTAEFEIAVDADIIKVYEEFDRLERVYFGEEKVSEKALDQKRRTYELSCVGKPPERLPFQPSFRHLTNILLVNELNIEKAIGYYEDQLTHKEDKDRLHNRAVCAKNWLENHAPDEFKYEVQSTINKELEIPQEYKDVFKEVAKRLKEKSWTDEELHDQFYILINNKELQVKDFFNYAYKVLIDREKGPKLANFILTIGKDKVANLFEQI